LDRRTPFVREPHFALDPHRGRDLPGYPHLRWHGDRMVVPHGGHLTVFICRLDIWDVVRACVAGWSGGLFGELLEGAG
jgi:hypothetical protein